MTLESLTSKGERIDPDMGHHSWLIEEHQERYRFARQLISSEGLDNQEAIIIDCACGTGYGIDFLNRAETEIIGVDIDFEACQYAAKRNGGNLIVQADARKLPFKNEVCDVVVSFETLEHVSLPEEIVSEFSRVIANQGLLIASTPERITLQAQSYRNHEKTFNPFHLAEMSSTELTSALKKNKLHDISLFGQRVFSKPMRAVYFSLLLPSVKRLEIIPEDLARKAARLFTILTTEPAVRQLKDNDKAEFVVATARKK